VESVANLVDGAGLGIKQSPVFIQGLFFEEAMNSFSRIHEVTIPSTVPVAGRKNRAMLLDVERLHDSING
jgi:hypothetical protein